MSKEDGVGVVDEEGFIHSGGFNAKLHRELLENAERVLATLPEGHPLRETQENALRIARERLERHGCLDELVNDSPQGLRP